MDGITPHRPPFQLQHGWARLREQEPGPAVAPGAAVGAQAWARWVKAQGRGHKENRAGGTSLEQHQEQR